MSICASVTNTILYWETEKWEPFMDQFFYKLSNIQNQENALFWHQSSKRSLYFPRAKDSNGKQLPKSCNPVSLTYLPIIRGLWASDWRPAWSSPAPHQLRCHSFQTGSTLKLNKTKIWEKAVKNPRSTFFYTRDFHNIKIIWVIPRTSSVRQKRFFDGFSAWILNSC